MAATPNNFVSPQNVLTATAVCTAAKTDLSNTANAVRLIAAGTNPNGTFLKRVVVVPRATAGATQAVLYRSYDSGTTLFPFASIQLPAYTANTSTAVTIGDFGFSEDQPGRQRAGEELWCSVGVALAAGFVFSAEYEAF